MRTSRRVGVVAFLLLVTAAAIAVLSPGSNQSNASMTPTVAPAGDGMRVYLDPETGEPGAQPSAAVVELNPELENALRHDDEGLTQVTHPNGAVSMNLEGRYEEATVVHIDANGKRIICTDNMHNVTNAPSAPEVK